MEEFDSVTGDYDFDARRFDSSNNQFIQPDSVIQNVYDPQALNHYSFERNNPYKYEDEDGHLLDPVDASMVLIGAFVTGFTYGEVSYQIDLQKQGFSRLSTQQLIDSQNAGINSGIQFAGDISWGLISEYYFVRIGLSGLSLFGSSLALGTISNAKIVGESQQCLETRLNSNNNNQVTNSNEVNSANSNSNSDSQQNSERTNSNSDTKETKKNTLGNFLKQTFSFIMGGSNNAEK